MKKILTFLFLAVIVASLCLSVNAATEKSVIVLPNEVNAPLNAIKFPYETQKTVADGQLEIDVVTPSVTFGKEVYSLSGLFLGTHFTAQAAFDAVIKYDTSKIPTNSTAQQGIAAYNLFTFFNPEVVTPIFYQDKNVYQLVDATLNSITADINKISENVLTDAMSCYMDYINALTDNPSQAETYLNDYNNSYKDGITAVAVSQPSDFKATELYINGYELHRIPFKLTDENNTNWYRTKIYLDYYNGCIANANQNTLSPTVTEPVYFENPNYDGPTFDIIGAMKKADGEIRFGSVYFTGNSDYYDNHAEILEMGIVCYPSMLLGTQPLSIDTEGAVKIPATGYYDKSVEGEIVYTGILSGLQGYENMHITAKSYIRYMDSKNVERIAYSDPISRSLNDLTTDAWK